MMVMVKSHNPNKNEKNFYKHRTVEKGRIEGHQKYKRQKMKTWKTWKRKKEEVGFAHNATRFICRR
jgi:hypothetical protein